MKRRAAMRLGVVLLWAASVARATPPADPDAQALLEAAGVPRRVEAWPEVSALARERAAARLDAERWALLQREVAQAFDPEALQRGLARSPGLLGDDAPALLRGFRESGAIGLLGPTEGYAPPALRDLPGFASQVSSGGIPPTRLPLIARVDQSTGFALDAWRVSSSVARAFARGARALACEGRAGTPGPDGAAWEAALSPEETGDLRALARPFRERVQVELLFDARERSGAELRRALRFLESDAARAFHARLEQALRRSLADASRVLGGRLAAEAARRCVE